MTRFEVVQLHRRWNVRRSYAVYEILYNSDGTIFTYRPLRRFHLLKTAEACAKGLAENTWIIHGQILSSWTSLYVTNKENSNGKTDLGSTFRSDYAEAVR